MAWWKINDRLDEEILPPPEKNNEKANNEYDEMTVRSFAEFTSDTITTTSARYEQRIMCG
jgi:hypothetical protein